MFPLGAGAFQAATALRGARAPWLLESALPGHQLSRFSFAGAEPWAILRGFSTPARFELEVLREVRPDLSVGRRTGEGDPLEVARRLLAPRPADAPPDLPFVGGAVGWLGYGLAPLCDRIALRPRAEAGLPDLALLFVDRLLVEDHAAGRSYALGLGFGADAAAAHERATRAARELAERIDAALQAPPHRTPRRAFGPLEVRSDRDETSYARAVEAIRERIARGDVYQACLTHRIEARFRGDPFDLYTELRRSNPAPCAAFLELPEAAIAGSSPERFLSLSAEGLLETRPIKGTRPRGATAAEDDALRRELAASAKDRAENVMIVDLARNDLGRVCEIGTVEAPGLFGIEPFAEVFQMVSRVTGRLRGDRDVFDAVRAAFPPGSMTGAPKLAAMAILDALEPAARGVYAGALGYFDARGGADLAVSIRTFCVRNGRATLGVGGGVVADSEPRAEWRESLDKARAPLAALAAATTPQSDAQVPSGTNLHTPFTRSLDGVSSPRFPPPR